MNNNKEIARRAIQAEFGRKTRKRRRNRRGGGGGGGGELDSSSSSDDDDRGRRRQSKKREVQSSSSARQQQDEPSSSKYRDRAQERREGKKRPSLDDDEEQQNLFARKSASDQVFDDIVDAVESGDRTRLARIRRTTSSRNDRASSQFPQNAAEALAWIAEAPDTATGEHRRTKTAVGKEMVSYLVETYGPKNKERRQERLQKKVLAHPPQSQVYQFRTYPCDPQCARLAWETPTVVVPRTANRNSSSDAAREKIPESLLLELNASWERRQRRQQRRQQQTHVVHNRQQSPSRHPNNKNEQSSKNDDDNSDDDDIFGNVGDYDNSAALSRAGNEEEGDPCQAKKEASNAQMKVVGDRSIFGDTKPEQDVSEMYDTVTAANPLVGTRLSSLHDQQSYYNREEEDGIAMDFGANEPYEDDDDDIETNKKDGSSKKANKKNKNSSSASDSDHSD